MGDGDWKIVCIRAKNEQKQEQQRKKDVRLLYEYVFKLKRNICKREFFEKITTTSATMNSWVLVSFKQLLLRKKSRRANWI